MKKAIVIGASSGGMEAIRHILSALPDSLNCPVFIVMHIGYNNIHHYLSVLAKKSRLQVREAEDKETIMKSTVYFAPPNYHLQIEPNNTLSLSTDKKVNYCRPSIDVLFETAAWTYKDQLIGVILTGSNRDGAAGTREIKKYGGITVVENPATAYARTMPRAALELTTPDYVLDLTDIAHQLVDLCAGK